MKKYLIVVDIQTDFVDGPLGTPEARAIIAPVANYVKEFEGKIFVTLDTHFDNYLSTREGKFLPIPHCIKGSDGWKLDKIIEDALIGKNITVIEKNTFGSVELVEAVKTDSAGESISIELVGLCTDICLVVNTMLLKTAFPNDEITVVANLCAGVTPTSHSAALTTMKMCQINIK